jgi:GNAT superfamily N-acetyltransferase
MMSEIIIRSADPVDLPKCAQIINDWIDKTAWMPRVASAEEIAANFDASLLKNRFFRVAEIRQEVCGYLSLDPTEHHIHGLYISHKYRGIGVGKALLDVAKESFPDFLKLAAFQANRKARQFYEREGFVEIGVSDGDNAEKLPDSVYRWEGQG